MLALQRSNETAAGHQPKLLRFRGLESELIGLAERQKRRAQDYLPHIVQWSGVETEENGELRRGLREEKLEAEFHFSWRSIAAGSLEFVSWAWCFSVWQGVAAEGQAGKSQISPEWRKDGGKLHWWLPSPSHFPSALKEPRLFGRRLLCKAFVVNNWPTSTLPNAADNHIGAHLALLMDLGCCVHLWDLNLSASPYWFRVDPKWVPSGVTLKPERISISSTVALLIVHSEPSWGKEMIGFGLDHNLMMMFTVSHSSESTKKLPVSHTCHRTRSVAGNRLTDRNVGKK